MTLSCYRCSAWPCECSDRVSLICGDNCDVMGQLPRGSIDLVVTSPPYDDLRTYGGHSWDFYGVAWNLKRLLKDGGVIVWIVNDETKDGDETGTSMRQALHFKEIGLRLHDTMIYLKDGVACHDPRNCRYRQQSEFMFVFSNGKPKAYNEIRDVPTINGGKTIRSMSKRLEDGSMRRTADEGRVFTISERCARSTVWQFNADKADRGHPAIFPEALARDHVLSWSNEGDLVLDPFNGSGTTTKMAKLTGRRAIGIDVNPEYMPIAANRLRQEVLQFTD